MSNHTPGPWKYHLGRGANPRFHIQTAGGYQIASTPELSTHPQAKVENEEREGNARLIASATELLAALEYAEKLIRTARQYFPKSIKNSDTFQLENTCAAIGKALGKARGSV